MFFALSKSLDLLAAPLTWATAWMLVALFFVLRRRTVGAAVACALAVLTLVGFATDHVANSLMSWVERPFVISYRPEVTYDVAIVLGGSIDLGADPPLSQVAFNGAAERMTESFRLLRAGKVRTLMVSGGDPFGFAAAPEAERAIEQWLSWGAAPEQLVTESRSRNTRENAVESAKLIAERGFKSILLITSAAHMPRALGCFRAVGLNVDTLPVDVRTYDRLRHGPRSWLPRAENLEKSTRHCESCSARRSTVGKLDPVELHRFRNHLIQ